MYHSCVSLILYSFILGELIETIKGLPDKFNSQLKSADPYRPFSSVETATGTKLSPNGAAIRQWETRSWISTIPLQKATSVNDNNHHHDLETGLTPTTTSTSTSSSSDDQFDYGESKYLSSSFRDNDPRDPRNYPIIMTSTNITHHNSPSSPSSSSSSSSSSGSTNDSSNCRGDNCRKSPFQGTYDTINYQKKMVYPDKQSTRIEEPTYSRGFRGDDDYGEEGGRQSEQPHHQNSYHRVHHHQRTHHNSNEPADRENEKNSRSNTGNPSNPHPLNWHHHAHPKGRSSRWESDMSSFDNNKDKDDHGSDHDDSDWNKKNWRERSNFGRDSGFNSKSFRGSMDNGDENDKKDHHFQRDHHQTRRRKYNNHDEGKDDNRPNKDHYEYDRREYEKERDREWKSYSNGKSSENDKNHDYNNNHNDSGYGNNKSGKDEHNEGRVEKSSREHNGSHNHPYHQRSYDSNGSNGGGRGNSGKSIGTKDKSKPKVKTYHHDEETPDGYSHAHGYEKEEVEGSRFFEPSGLTGQDNSNNHHHHHPASTSSGSHHHHHHYPSDYNQTSTDDYRHSNEGHTRPTSGRSIGKNKPECDCSGKNGKNHHYDVPDVADSKAKAASAAASAARVKRQDETSNKNVFGIRSKLTPKYLSTVNHVNYTFNSN